MSKKRNLSQILAFSLMGISCLLVIGSVVFIISYIIVHGAGGINWEFLSQLPKKRGIEGGIFSAILGTFYLMVGVVVFALPVGLLAAIYLQEYARQGRIVRLINLSIVNLAGVPSIVYGLFGLSFFVLMMKMGSSLLAASLTLSCLVLPVVVTAAREALAAVPNSFREASLALGATKWQTIRRVVLPQAYPGIITGIILAVSRAAGETAPILVTGTAFTAILPRSPLDQFNALPYHLYVVATQVPGIPPEIKWATALVLLGLVLLFNLTAIIMRARLRAFKKKWS
ncbi:MAG: phosphate ABC transporter permease PstA [Caldiserica bacterium]|nr:phosphate ABC transporter permease PstA [Caldisericota bacterium]MDH7562609.1 phosphate ABC transporter permease PstA [Caldisericota bacterium]